VRLFAARAAANGQKVIAQWQETAKNHSEITRHDDQTRK
jgi:hypothetical protein